MRIAVLADIHANLPALQRVLGHLDPWQPDHVVVAGDVVNRGPQPVECFDLIDARARRNGWRVLKGNHEDFVLLAAASHESRPAWVEQLCAHSAWTSRQLGCERIERITGWPDSVELELAGLGLVRCVHASVLGNRHGLYPRMTDEELRRGAGERAAVLCAGHTHIPFVRTVGGELVVNVGSVGLPFDRDDRAAYARLEHKAGGWSAEIVRLSYDRAQTESAFVSKGYLRDGGPMVPLILDELRNARPRLRQWHDDYESLVASGLMDVTSSVRAQLGMHRA